MRILIVAPCSLQLQSATPRWENAGIGDGSPEGGGRGRLLPSWSSWFAISPRSRRGCQAMSRSVGAVRTPQ